MGTAVGGLVVVISLITIVAFFIRAKVIAATSVAPFPKAFFNNHTTGNKINLNSLLDKHQTGFSQRGMTPVSSE